MSRMLTTVQRSRVAAAYPPLFASARYDLWVKLRQVSQLDAQPWPGSIT
jgi:hypothetical protein